MFKYLSIYIGAKGYIIIFKWCIIFEIIKIKVNGDENEEIYI